MTSRARVEVAKGPASGWLEIAATNRPADEEGKPIEGAPVGTLHIWGKGEAKIAFGKILTGTAGIEYTPDGPGDHRRRNRDAADLRAVPEKGLVAGKSRCSR